MELITITEEELMIEFEQIRKQSKDIRVKHCVQRFMIWRKAGLSPNEIKEQYGLSGHDMYGLIIDTVSAQTGIDRLQLLKYPGRGRSEHSAAARKAKLEEDLSEAQKLIALYRKLHEQATALQHCIENTLKQGGTTHE